MAPTFPSRKSLVLASNRPLLTLAYLASSWETRHEYVALVEQYRLNECKLQVDAIRRGLATIVPIQLYVHLTCVTFFVWSLQLVLFHYQVAVIHLVRD